MPQASNHPEISSVQVDQLRGLQDRIDHLHKPRAKKRLEVLLALAAGHPPAKIQNVCEISGPGFRNIRAKVAEGHLPEMIAELEKMVTPVTQGRLSSVARPGRPSTSTLRTIAINAHAKNDVLVEMVYLRLTAIIQVAVIAVRVPLRDPDADSIKSRLIRVLRYRMKTAIREAEFEAPRWTEWPSDWGARENLQGTSARV